MLVPGSVVILVSPGWDARRGSTGHTRVKDPDSGPERRLFSLSLSPLRDELFSLFSLLDFSRRFSS